MVFYSPRSDQFNSARRALLTTDLDLLFGIQLFCIWKDKLKIGDRLEFLLVDDNQQIPEGFDHCDVEPPLLKFTASMRLLFLFSLNLFCFIYLSTSSLS